MAGEADAVILLLLAFIFPPAAVAFVAGCSADLCLNILLTLLGYLPGCLHAFWLILRRAEANERYGYKNWTYAGMGECVPTNQGLPPGAQYAAPYGQAQPPPPPGQDQPPAVNVSPASQPPVHSKGGYGYVPPPAPTESKHGGYQDVDQKWGEHALPLAPADQKDGGGEVPLQAPADQKYADSTAPTSGG